jgi:hypothetical protein
MEVEDIKHMAFDCIVAKNICNVVFTEWWSHTTESWWLNHPKFEEAFFNEGTSTFEVLRRTLNEIATYQFWRYRCNILYRGDHPYRSDSQQHLGGIHPDIAGQIKSYQSQG